MANRSYLYASNIEPMRPVPSNRKMIGISEWNYDIPLVYRILLSGKPQRCQSSIWEIDDPIALVGDFETGADRLRSFLQRIERPDAKELVDETLNFLADTKNIEKHLVLECGEIFDMSGEDLNTQASNLFDSISRTLENETNTALKRINNPRASKTGLFGRLLGGKKEKDEDPLADIYALGLGNWSNILYYDLSDS